MIPVALENPLIRFNIPNSPLLFSLPLDAGSHPTHLSTSSAPPCTMSPSKKPHFHNLLASASSSLNFSLTFQPSSTVPAVVITRPLSNDRSPPPPSHCTPPRPKPRLSSAASKKLVEFIDFLEKIDRDMTAEIQHVKESIKEAHEYVGEWQGERRARTAELLRRKERERRETKEPDSDFWLGI
ncbi:hypothetical protein EDB89DRAFT_1939349 [Lactarius sanguifluus]|nr:hypothetical protein EDB89DRAFT_1939349 [Lactarius sanguifluus]